MSHAAPTDPLTHECPMCHTNLARRKWYRSRKFWSALLAMSVVPTTYPLMELPPVHVGLMMFPPMALGFGEWMLDFVKELTRMLKAWKTAGMPTPLLADPSAAA